MSRYQYRIDIYFKSENEQRKYNNLVTEFMETNKVKWKSEAMKQMLVLGSEATRNKKANEVNAQKFTDVVNKITEKLNLMELETRYLVNNRKHKETLPKTILDNWKEK